MSHVQEIRSDFLTFQPAGSRCRSTTLVLLNHVLPQATAKLWSQASFKICADGGSNRLYDALPSMLGITEEEAGTQRQAFAPNMIMGDLDSVRQDVREFYEKVCLVPVVDLSEDQDSTDLGKCLAYIEREVLRHSEGGPQSSLASSSSSCSQQDSVNDHHIIVLGALGGRVDHTLSNLNALYQFSHLNITLWGEGNLVRLVRPGSCVIHPLRAVEGPSCGLVPLSGPATASSTGLKWNLDGTRLEMGGLISTCNVMEASEITVVTDRAMLWTTTVSEQV